MPVLVQALVGQAWQPLQGNFFKLNFDKVCFDNGVALGYSAIVRNGNDEVMAAISAKGGAVKDSEEVEVMACRKALELAINVGFMEVILEGDNAMVMKKISQAQPNFSRVGLIYEDIWCLDVGFRSISVNCIRRSVNNISRPFNNEIIWIEENSPPIMDALYLESSILY